MKIIEPKIELTRKEVEAINTVVSLCEDLSNMNDNFLDLIFDEYASDDFSNTIETLDNILDACELEKKGNEKNDSQTM